MKEAGLSYSEMASLNLYWKRLMMGYKEPKPISLNEIVPLSLVFQPARALQQDPSGWLVPRK